MKSIDFTYNLADDSRAMLQLIPPFGTFESIEWFHFGSMTREHLHGIRIWNIEIKNIVDKPKTAHSNSNALVCYVYRKSQLSHRRNHETTF
jgi:hypothetical protein